jgi:hypothetical protein
MSRRGISIERYGVDGFTLSAIVRGYLVSERYIGYSLQEAHTLFSHKYM